MAEPPPARRPLARPPQWPWEISDDDDLHAVQSDPTVIPHIPYAQTDAPPDHRPGGPRRLQTLIVGGVAVVVIVAVGVVLLTRHPGTASADNTSATVKSAHSNSPNFAQLRATPEGQAAVALAGLLQQAADQLGDVPGATADVRDCGLKLQDDASVFYSAAGDRRRLLAGLPHLVDRSALPSSLLQELTGDWQESNMQYTDLGHWADVAIYQGCVKQDIDSNADLRDSYAPGDAASRDRAAFVKVWDPVAGKYGLHTYPAGLI